MHDIKKTKGSWPNFTCNINHSRPNPGRREKIKLSFYFHIFCGASKGFMKALKGENKNLT